MDDEKTVLLTDVANEDSQVQDEGNIDNIIPRTLIWKSPKFIITVALCLMAVTVAVMVAISSAGGEKDDIAQKLETAQKYLTEMKYEEAKVLFEEVIESDPKCE